MTKAYLDKGWKVIAAVRDTSKMPKVDGDILVVKLEVGEKGDAKNICLVFLLLPPLHGHTCLLQTLHSVVSFSRYNYHVVV